MTWQAGHQPVILTPVGSQPRLTTWVETGLGLVQLAQAVRIGFR